MPRDATSDYSGIILIIIKEIFNQATLDLNTGFTFTFSMLEMYMRQLWDFLAP